MNKKVLNRCRKLLRQLIWKHEYPYYGSLDLSKPIDYSKFQFPLSGEEKITSEQLFGKETARLMDELEQSWGPQIILIPYRWWDRLIEKMLRMILRF